MTCAKITSNEDAIVVLFDEPLSCLETNHDYPLLVSSVICWVCRFVFVLCQFLVEDVCDMGTCNLVYGISFCRKMVNIHWIIGSIWIIFRFFLYLKKINLWIVAIDFSYCFDESFFTVDSRILKEGLMLKLRVLC